MKTNIKSIIINGNLIEVNDVVNIKNDTEKGIIEEIQYSGHFEEYRKYDLMIKWEDEDTLRTPMAYFDEFMEKTLN